MRSSKLGRSAATAWMAFGAALAIALFLSTLPSEPYARIFHDELLYAQQAHDIANGSIPRYNGTVVAKYPPLYSAVIAPAYWIGEGGVAAWWMRCINALLACSTLIPVYRLARMRLARGPSLLAAFASILQPFQAYVGSLMSENLFIPLFAWLVLAFVRWADDPTPSRRVAAGVVLGLCVLTKSIAILFLIAVFFALAWARRALWRPLVQTGGLAAIAAVVFLPWQFRAWWLPSERGLTAYYSYLREFTFGGVAQLETYLFWIRASIGIAPIAVGALVLAVAIAVIGRMVRAQSPAERFFGAFIVFAVLGITLFAAIWSTQVSFYTSSVHGRYLVMFWPIVVVFFFFGLGRGRCTRRGLLVGASVSALCIVLTPKEVFDWPGGPSSLTNFPSSELVRFGMSHAWVTRFALAAPLLLLVPIGFGSRWLQRASATAMVLVACGYLIVQCVYTTIRTNELAGYQASAFGPALDWLDRHVDPDEAVVFHDEPSDLRYQWALLRMREYAWVASGYYKMGDSSIWLYPELKRWLARGRENPTGIWIVSRKDELPFPARLVSKHYDWRLFRPAWTAGRIRTPVRSGS